MKTLIGKTFNGIVAIDMAIEKELDREVTGFTESKQDAEVTYVFKIDDGRRVEVITVETPYEIFVKSAMVL